MADTKLFVSAIYLIIPKGYNDSSFDVYLTEPRRGGMIRVGLCHPFGVYKNRSNFISIIISRLRRFYAWVNSAHKIPK